MQEQPQHADAAANLAALLEKTNALDDALAWADHALRIAPANRSAQLTRAACLRRLGHLEEAAGFLQAMLTESMPPISEIDLEALPGDRIHIVALDLLAGGKSDRVHENVIAIPVPGQVAVDLVDLLIMCDIQRQNDRSGHPGRVTAGAVAARHQ